jgi:hypothetical protein
MVDGLDAVPVEVEQERAVVVLPVLRARPGLPVALVPRDSPRAPELVDELARANGERDVKTLRRAIRAFGRADEELVSPEGRELVGRVRLGDADGTEDGVVEPLGRLLVGGADRDVVEQASETNRSSARNSRRRP